uniref:Putative reverse transcriptase (RNA-dependent DNA polymerase) domain containing protein n=1 Tax=Malus domestica TaxID=3750 RepID=E4Z8K6_MALDO|nr:putative reverse transcriptase (RNA-dependent DNA polymerase) domain containing protein [Malus domestica]
MEKDCKSYARGCEECQRHGPLQHVPLVPLNPVVKPWPFRGWAMDFIGQIYPASSKGHTFIIVATDYFTKWVEASAVKSITSATVKNFIETKILHIFGVPETIVTDRGPSFISKEVEEFASKYKIKMIQSSPYYPQSNDQAEASNKILVNIIKRMVIDSPEKWHENLGNTLWAYRTSKRAGTGTTPYALTFGQDAMLPVEINVSSVRIQNQFGLHSEEYIEAMCQGIEDLDAARIEALNQIQEGKRVVARAYNKKVKMKSFKEGDLVWKTVLPLGAQLRGFGKWSPTWEGPFIISRVLDRGGYYLADLEGNRHKHPINVNFLKKYCPTLWDLIDCYIEEDAGVYLLIIQEDGKTRVAEIMYISFRQIDEIYKRFKADVLQSILLLDAMVSSADLPMSSWIEPNQVIGLCGQHEPGRGSSDRTITIGDGQARLITTISRKTSLREETA